MINLLVNLFRRKPKPAIDRSIELQDNVEIYEPEQPAPHKLSTPTIVHYEGRKQLIERGYWAPRKPKSVKRCNVDIETLIEPGALRRMNRLIRRGYYQSLRMH